MRSSGLVQSSSSLKPIANNARKLQRDEKSLDEGMHDIMQENKSCSLGTAAVVRVAFGEQGTWPGAGSQAGWPTDPVILMFLNWQGDLPIPQTASIRVPEPVLQTVTSRVSARVMQRFSCAQD